MMTNRQETEPYVSDFRDYQANGAGRGPTWLKKLRESAIASFEKLGFPSTRDEDWRHTNVGPLLATGFERAAHRTDETTKIAADAIQSLSFAETANIRLVFVNGACSPELSRWHRLPVGTRVESLASGLTRNEGILHAYLSGYARYQDQPFVALNTAFIEDGALVLIPDSAVIEEPIYLIFVSTARHGRVVSHPRNLIFVGEGSRTRIVESHLGTASGAYFSNAVTEIFGHNAATIEHYLLQQGGDEGVHVGNVEVQLNRQCNFSAHAITLSGALVRNDAHVVLKGEGSECTLNGLYLVDGKQHVDNHTEIEHCMPRAKSQELYKGILSGSARGVFNGKIRVHKDAQKSDARQTNKNLVLSENAVINTKPQLEIYADDVKCSHGSTVGQLDRDSLFYLRARGIGVAEAQSLLCYAFASEVVNKIKIATMREELDTFLLRKFRSDQHAGHP